MPGKGFSGTAPYIRLPDFDPAYNVLMVAFASSGSNGSVSFTPKFQSADEFKADIQVRVCVIASCGCCVTLSLPPYDSLLNSFFTWSIFPGCVYIAQVSKRPRVVAFASAFSREKRRYCSTRRMHMGLPNTRTPLHMHATQQAAKAQGRKVCISLGGADGALSVTAANADAFASSLSDMPVSYTHLRAHET